jgi:hypothetical protein
MRSMPISVSNRRSVLALASFVVGLGGVWGPAAVGPFAQEAIAQQPRPGAKKKDKEKKEADAAAAATTTAEEEEKKRAADAQKKPDEPPKEEKKEFDDTVEAQKAIYASADIGFTHANLGAIVDNTGFDKTGANGTLWGFSGGYRVRDFRAGVRWRVYDTTEFALWSIALQAGYAMKLRPVTPIFSAHLGYVFSQNIEPALYPNAIPPGTILPPNVDVKGLMVGLDANASYWVTKWFRLGAFLGFDLMFLSREQTTVPRSITGAPPQEITNHPLYTESGFGMGINVLFGFRAAFDLGFE